MPEGRLLEVPAGIIQTHAQHLGIGDELGDGVHHHRVALLALVLGDELGQADEQLRQAHRLDHAAGALPQAERLRQAAGELHFTRQEDAIPRHQHVVEHDEAFRHAVMGARRIVEFVQRRRREAAVDDADALGVDRDRERDRVVLLVLAHAFGRHHHQLMDQRRRGDVQLGAAHDDAVLGAVDDPDIEIRVVLLVGAALAVALGIGDDFGRAQVVVAAIAVHALDVGRALRIDLGDVVLDAHQRHR